MNKYFIKKKNKKDKQKVKVKIEGDIPFIRKVEKEEKVKKQEDIL